MDTSTSSSRTPLRTAPAWRLPASTPGWALLLVALLAYPLLVPSFWAYQIGAQSLVLGTIALSLSFLAGYGGMVSLAQMTVAGLAAYLVCIFGVSAVDTVSLGWPRWLAIALALPIATLSGVAIGTLSMRTEGIRTIMITLAIGVAFFYLTQQNYAVFNGYQGFSGVTATPLAGIDLSAPVPFYYLCLAVAGALAIGVGYLARSTFGIALQGVRDNPRRMASLGFSVTAHRLLAHAIAGFIAAVGGVLFVFYNHQISPGSVSTAALINVLVIAVLGGMRHPVGAFVGAAVFVLLQNFAIDLVSRERFNLVIGGVFLLVVLVSPDGVLGLASRLRGFLRPASRDQGR
ncbi:branched-chain amino acid ABC transporter permease [Variovorax boronicumulans]|uniref:branched-chain amino acid ABC transporter permease n=1 Tax=Variovorax boronicumulans TaxID=436515 RepID=UPI001C5944A8